jgi:hypothetical protein
VQATQDCVCLETWCRMWLAAPDLSWAEIILREAALDNAA